MIIIARSKSKLAATSLGRATLERFRQSSIDRAQDRNCADLIQSV